MFLHLSGKHGRIPKGALQRVNLFEKSSGASGRSSKTHDIVTLDPGKFVEMKQQCLHIGNQQRFRPRIWFKIFTPVMAPYLHYDSILLTQSNPSYPPYPPDMKAFLYYYMSPDKPRISGELRLRVMSSKYPASFESGSDLLRPNGRTWMRPLYGLRSKYYFPLYAKLREDQLVSDELDAVISTLPSMSPKYRRSQLLYTLNDTFILNFSSESQFFVITEQGVEKLPLKDIFRDSRGSGKAKPYTGSILARFERSMLPHHKGTRTAVLRFLKIITPVKCVVPSYDGYICCPKEGELFQRILKYSVNHQVWSINIDKPKSIKRARGLQLLWDT